MVSGATSRDDKPGQPHQYHDDHARPQPERPLRNRFGGLRGGHVQTILSVRGFCSVFFVNCVAATARDRALAVADDLAKDLAATLLTAPGSGILVAVKNDPGGVGAHPRNRKVGQRDDGSVAGPFDGHGQR